MGGRTGGGVGGAGGGGALGGLGSKHANQTELLTMLSTAMKPGRSAESRNLGVRAFAEMVTASVDLEDGDGVGGLMGVAVPSTRDTSSSSSSSGCARSSGGAAAAAAGGGCCSSSGAAGVACAGDGARHHLISPKSYRLLPNG